MGTILNTLSWRVPDEPRVTSQNPITHRVFSAIRSTSEQIMKEPNARALNGWPVKAGSRVGAGLQIVDDIMKERSKFQMTVDDTLGNMYPGTRFLRRNRQEEVVLNGYQKRHEAALATNTLTTEQRVEIEKAARHCAENAARTRKYITSIEEIGETHEWPQEVIHPPRKPWLILFGRRTVPPSVHIQNKPVTLPTSQKSTVYKKPAPLTHRPHHDNRVLKAFSGVIKKAHDVVFNTNNQRIGDPKYLAKVDRLLSTGEQRVVRALARETTTVEVKKNMQDQLGKYKSDMAVSLVRRITKQGGTNIVTCDVDQREQFVDTRKKLVEMFTPLFLNKLPPDADILEIAIGPSEYVSKDKIRQICGDERALEQYSPMILEPLKSRTLSRDRVTLYGGKEIISRQMALDDFITRLMQKIQWPTGRVKLDQTGGYILTDALAYYAVPRVADRRHTVAELGFLSAKNLIGIFSNMDLRYCGFYKPEILPVDTHTSTPTAQQDAHLMQPKNILFRDVTDLVAISKKAA